jgi:hypothetical protein
MNSNLPNEVKRGLSKTLDKTQYQQEVQLKAISNPKDFIDKYIDFNMQTKKLMLKSAEDTFLEQTKEGVDTETASKVADETARRIIQNRESICDVKFPQTAVNMAYKLLKEGAQAQEILDKIRGKAKE